MDVQVFELLLVMYKILMIPRNWLLLMKFIYASVCLFEFVDYMLRYQKMLTKL